MPEIAYVNGEYMPLAAATVSVEDRGFQFADGVYEVMITHGGKPYALQRRLRRLERSLRELLFDVDIGPAGLDIQRTLAKGIARAGYAETFVYLQLTRGVAPRQHPFPALLPPPTVVMTFREAMRIPEETYAQGARAITTRDLRWKRCDVKSVSLLPNVLASEAAARAGSAEALLVDDEGYITEGASTSCFCVVGGQLRTTPAGNRILPSITRGLLHDLAAQAGIPWREVRSTPADYLAADEVFLAATGLEVMPVVELDGQRIGDGQRGPVTRRLREAFVRGLETGAFDAAEPDGGGAN